MASSDIYDGDDVVISGISLRLPGISTYDQFSKKLINGLAMNSLLKEKTPRGYHGDFPKPGHRISGSSELDSVFFGMNNIVFDSADRNQLKSLELSVEALYDAGFTPKDVAGLVVETFQNPTRSDGDYLPTTHSTSKNRSSILGKGRTLAANRVSFAFGFDGQSGSVDSHQTGGMAMLDLGWRDVKSGRCDMAIVVTTNLFIDECITAHLHDKGWLSTDGKTKSFDDQASGYQRSEAVVAFVLQRAKIARRIYTRILHVSYSTGVNTNSIETPSKESWIQFLNESYKKNGISKDKIQYLEAYGSGIKEFDASELNAIAEFFNTKEKDSLIIGSVKSNVGHTDAASDMISIIKAIVCFQNGIIPANRDYTTPNTDIPALVAGQLKVADQNIELSDDALIAVNGYSLGNSFGHCILGGFHKAKSPIVEIPRLVPLSARLDEFMPTLFEQVLKSQSDNDYLQLVTDVFSQRFDRHLGRGCMILSQDKVPITMNQAWNDQKQPLWFVFSGMGSQWPGMGKDLMKLPLALASLQKCHDILLPKGMNLLEIVTSDNPEIFKDNLNSFVGIAAIQIALVDVLRALKIVPDGIIGHSLGELGCAFADNSLSLDQTILSAYYRGKAVKDATLKRGAMAAIGKGFEEIKNFLPENVEVACHNSSSSTTISGEEEPVFNFVEKLKADRVFAKVVDVGNVGFHSKCIAPAGPFLISYMKQVIKKPILRSPKWVSTSVPEGQWEEEESLYSSPEYFTNNLLRSVLFEEACKHIPENAILVEIAPHGLLQAILKRSFPKATNIPLTSRSSPDNLIFLLQAIGKLYMTGLSPEINALYPKVNYPVATKTKSLHGLFPWCPTVKQFELTETAKSQIDIRSLLKKSNNFTQEHVFRGRRITPFSYYPFLVWYTYYQADPSVSNSTLIIRDLRVFDPFELSIEQDFCIDGIALQNSAIVELTKDGKLFCSATAIKPEDDSTLSSIVRMDQEEQNVLTSLTKREIYDFLEHRGYLIADKLQLLQSAQWLSGEMRAKVAFTRDWEKILEAMIHLMFLNQLKTGSYGLATIKSFGRIEVTKNVTETPSPKELDIFYNTATNDLACGGLTVSDIKFKYHVEPRNISLSSIIPYAKTPLKTVQEYIRFCVQAVDPYKAVGEESGVKVLEVEQEHFQPIGFDIADLLSKVDQIEEKKSSAEKKGVQHLVICSRQHFLMHSQEMGDFTALRDLPNLEAFKEPVGFSKISSFAFHDETFTLLKKIKDTEENKDFILIPREENDLIETLKGYQKSRNKIIVVGVSEPADGILNYINITNLHTSLELSWFFILDNTAPAFDPKLPLYKKQLEKGLILNVLFNDSWSFVYQKELIAIKNSHDTNNLTLENGIDIGDKKLALNFDLELNWILPAEWSMVNNKEEIIKAYALMYDCLAIKVAVASYDKVLVTDGCSLLGQVAIAVAFSRTDDVMASVANKEEAHQLVKCFPRLKLDKIILHSDDFILQLKNTFNKNVKDYPNIIVNLLDGKPIFDILRYSSRFSSIFHFGKDAIENNNKMGLYPFISYVNFFGVSPVAIPEWPQVEKQKIKSLLAKGIESGVVKPLKDIKKSTPIGVGSKKENQRELNFRVKADEAYLIIGDSSLVDLDIAEWLIEQGAKNVIVYNPSQTKSNEFKLRTHLLNNDRLKVQTSTATSINDLRNIIESCGSKIHAIISISLDNAESAADVDSVLSKLNDNFDYFVKISRNRQRYLQLKNLQTDIIWNLENYLIKPYLGTLVNYIGDHAFISIDSNSKTKDHKVQHNFWKELVPKSIKALEVIGSGLSKSSVLVELSTSALKLANTTLDCQPVFIIPGLEAHPVLTASALVKDLLEPAFVANVGLVGDSSILDLARTVANEILRVNDRKIYHLVGLSTGCVLAMEVARLLEKKQKAVAILLVNNPYQTLQKLSRKLDLSSSLLNLFTFDETKNELTEDESSIDWSQRLNRLVCSLGVISDSEVFVTKAVSHINNVMKAIVSHDIDNMELKGPLSVIKSSNIIDDLHYSKICYDSYIEDFSGSHTELLKSAYLTKVMNKFVVLEDVSLKTVHEVLWVPFEKKLDEFRKVISEETIVNW